MINDFGRALLDLCVCFDLFIHNGECQGDEEGKFTYISGHSNSVIDYCITSVDFVKHVKRLCVQNRVESPHMPVEVTIACSFRAEH